MLVDSLETELRILELQKRLAAQLQVCSLNSKQGCLLSGSLVLILSEYDHCPAVLGSPKWRLLSADVVLMQQADTVLHRVSDQYDQILDMHVADLNCLNRSECGAATCSPGAVCVC